MPAAKYIKTFLKLLVWGAVLAIVGFALLLGGLLWLDAHPTPNSGFGWIQKISGVRFPPGVTNFVSYDNRETFVTAHLTIPAAELTGFTQRNRFERAPRAAWIREPEKLAAPFSRLPNLPSLSLFGRSKTNTWVFVLPQTRELWVTVEYPDFSGDPP